MQSSAAGENVITDLRTILEDALERIKSEIFGPGHEAPGRRAPEDSAGQAGPPKRPRRRPRIRPSRTEGSSHRRPLRPPAPGAATA